jgi:hypothetical protein
MHAQALGKWLLTVTALFLAVAYAGGIAARQVVAHSGFRLAIAAHGAASLTNTPLQVAIGNSQLMDGLNATQINGSRRDIRFLNLAFNGLESTDVLAVLETFYKTCRCTVERLYVNAGALQDDTPGTSEVRIFMSAFNRELMPTMLQDNPSMRISLSVLPLLHFNDEVFHRTAYYWLLGTDDQAHGNDYSFRIPNITPNRLGGTQKKPQIDIARVRSIVSLLHAHNTEITGVMPPLHPLYVHNRVGYLEYVSQVRQILGDVGVPLLDHSAGIVTDYDSFADLIHLNLKGQSIYSRYFAERVIPSGRAEAALAR